VPVVAVASIGAAWASGAMAAPVGAMAAIMSIDGAATVDQAAERVPGSISGPLPTEALPVDTSDPDRVIGTGNPASCTSAAVVAAVAAGGVITFDCGPDPVTIVMTATAKVVNTSPTVVIDGGGLVTLSGADQRRILYMNTCDAAQIWTTSHCQNQDQPRLTIQRIGFTRGNSTGSTVDGGGGGAVFVRGGQVRVIDSTFTANRCEATGPDIGGGALRVLSQYDGRPVIVAGSMFGGGGSDGNTCSNGGAISSIGVSWRIYDTDFVANRAIGIGANPQRPGTPGGGNGGAIALDGNLFQLELLGSRARDNVANEGGGSIFFVSNNRTGQLRIADSTLSGNVSLGFETAGLPGIFYLGNGPAQVTNSTLG
jgi:hypothetical protein